ncbi:MAG: starch-binding protein [Ruminococcus sp.]|nr:starch-binding protein [Ruminococcus sp.]
MKKKIISSLLTASMLSSCFTVGSFSAQAVTVDNSDAVSAVQSTDSVGTGSTEPQERIEGSAVLHCFNWSYNTIRENLADIKAAGYTAVQTNAAQTPKMYSAYSTKGLDNWWKFYQPLTISVADGNNWLGTRAELKALCDEAEAMGMKVMVDVVANHMAAETSSKENSLSNVDVNVEPILRSSEDYWHINKIKVSDDNRYTITQGCMGQPDLNTGNSYIQQRYKDLLIDLIDIGVDGFRFDAAKHIETPDDDPSIASDFWPVVINGSQASTDNEIYYYGEILGSAGISISSYTKYMHVTDNATGDFALYNTVKGNAAQLANSNYQKGAGASKALLWVESHDTYLGNAWTADDLRCTADLSSETLAKAWAIVGSRANATSLYFARPAETMCEVGDDLGWKSKAVAEVNKFKNYFNGTSEYLSYSGNTAYNERGNSGVVISKLDGAGNVSLTAHTMVNGTYTDQITGNKFTVSGGKITGNVGSTGVAVVYNNETQPTAYASPTSKSYTDTLTITLGYHNADSGLYSVNGGSYKAFTKGEKLTIGEGLSYGTATTIKVKAVSGNTTSEEVSYVYTKADPNAKQMIYFDNSAYNWSQVNAYIYAVTPEWKTITNGSWPGQALKYDSATGYYALEVGDDLKNGFVMFSENLGNESHRYPADGAEGLGLDGTTKLFKAGYKFEEYTPQISTTATTTSPVTTKDYIYFKNTSNWSTPYAYYWGASNLNMVAWPGTAMESVGNSTYRVAVPSDAKYVIFSNKGGSQTADLTIPSLNYIYNNGSWSAYNQPTTAKVTTAPTTVKPTTAPTTAKVTTVPTTVKPTTAPTTAKVTTAPTTVAGKNYIYFKNTSNWSTPYAYYWGASNLNMVAWPGTAMESVGNSTYRVAVPSDAKYVIFSNKGGSQTADLTIPSLNYIYNNGSWSAYNQPTTAKVTTAPTTVRPTTVPVTTPSTTTVTESYNVGDADLDKTVNIKDATAIQKYLVEMQTFTATAMAAADADRNGMVNIKDATIIQKYLAGFETNEYIGKSSDYVPDTSIATTPVPQTTAPVTSPVTTPTEAVKNYIYFKNNSNWSTPYAYYWSDDNHHMIEWPGIAMSSIGNSTYRIEVPADAKYVIFSNNGGSQTADITINSFGYIYSNGSWSKYEEIPTNPTIVPTSSSTGYIYFENSSNWSAPYAYYWGGTTAIPDWPGVAMEKVSGNVYRISIPTTAQNVIFSNNGGSQTADLTAQFGKIYTSSGWKDYNG